MSDKNGDTRQIGILGGTFDPIHAGHIAMAVSAIDTCQLDHVYFVPAGDPPHKKKQRLTAAHHRFTMTQLALEEVKCCSVCDYEIRKPETSYTIHLVKHYQHKFPNDTLHLIIGTDSLMDIHNWYQFEELLRSIHIIALNRPGDLSANIKMQVNRFTQLYGAQITYIDSFHEAISSTDIRDKISTEDENSVTIPEQVIRYINRHDLYRSR